MPSFPSVLIVGVGSIGERHLRCFQNTGRADLAICEVHQALRDRVGQQYGIDRRYSDLESALASQRFDAAVIATPAPLHIPMAAQLAEAGVHLLIEKPLSTSLEGVERLVQIIRGRNLTAAVAYVHRANPILHAMKNAIDSGRFGRPVEAVVVTGQHFPTFRPAYREIYYKNRATGGGAIQDALTHLFNAVEWLVGPIDRILIDAEHQLLEGVDVEDTVHALTRHGRTQGSFCLNQHQAPNEMTITVVCERGTARFEYHRNRWRWAEKPNEPWHDEQGGELIRDTLFIRQANNFLDAVARLDSPLCSLDDGIQTLRVNLAALASAENQSWQNVRP